MSAVEATFEKRGLKVRVEPKYKLFTPDQIVEEIEKISKDASEIIGFLHENCKILLHHFKWDPINLTEKFYEASSPKIFLQKNGIKLIDESVKDDMVTIDECKKCKEFKEVVILSCSHLFCFDCWKNILKIANEKSGNKNTLPYLTCTCEGCTTPISETFTLQLFSDQQSLYQNMVINSFVESNPEFKWCPNQKNGCEKAVKIESSSKVEEITCTCGYTYCFSCEDLPHSPFPCIFIEKWKLDFSTYILQINESLIACPKCNVDYGFCNGKGFIKCIKCTHYFDASLARPSEIDRHIARREFKFYKLHDKLLKNEYKHLRDLDEIKHETVSHLKIALKVLHNLRHKFYHFYVFSYFLDEPKKYGSFEDNMMHVEDSLDKATKIINVPQYSNDFFYSPEQLKEIIDVLVIIKMRLDALFKAFYEDEWKCNDKDIEKVMHKYKY